MEQYNQDSTIDKVRTAELRALKDWHSTAKFLYP